MQIEDTLLKGCFIITPSIFHDNRGFFFESFNSKAFDKLTGKKIQFVQDNQSHSKKGALRGLHFQDNEFAQAKLVQVTKGSVLDICVDIRETSPTFGKHIAIQISEDNKKQVFIPRGFAHGFLALEDHTIFSYKCDNYYNKDAERGIIYNDKSLNIDWNFPQEDVIISEKDLQLPTFENVFK